jgi:hypothetical protein
MTTKYKEFENNSEVMDALFCIIDGKDNVKNMVKILKQPQSTISTKLQFLRGNDVIIKEKWKFRPNWKIITKIFQSEIKKVFEDLLDFFKDVSQLEKDKIKMIRNMMEKIPEVFNENRVASIYEMYACYFSDGCVKRISTSELAELYVEMLKRTDTAKFKKFDKDIVLVKRMFNRLGIRDVEEDFFIQVEKGIEWMKKRKPHKKLADGMVDVENGIIGETTEDDIKTKKG